ncbi:4Fe-4S binding protein [Dehalobacterium formicoaceticum]|uniref:4Fe-4S binding protein n=1 Tax=Dehalobacterium formicoaceticum TaxID=51515 RepID=A0ABT1Y0W9_9FIRM|nr:4Fe-4S binding protein [Dehalobacterium formicoaceticum]MCR6544514.1 4Fe-4S binding protein [Dehalobacterium formicoaceticum]
MLNQTGIPGAADLRKVLPSEERMLQGPVAIIECFQEIPCNPCTEACKQGAILPMQDINDLPKMAFEKCNGCGLCISRCPGLAIFIVDFSYRPTEAVVRIPYEFVPLPEAGQKVMGLNRAGEVLGTFEVKKVQSGGKKNMTYTIWLVVPRELAMEVRNIRLGGDKHGA